MMSLSADIPNSMPMDICINGKTSAVPDDISARKLIEMLDLGGRRIAIEINGEIVPRSAHAGHKLAPGDRVEIVQAVGGG